MSPPRPPKPIEANVSSDLRAAPQWALWEFRWAGDKWTKVPINTETFSGADSTDAATWSSWAVVQRILSRETAYGAAFMFSDHDPFFGFDCDDCVNPDTGEVAPWVAAYVRRFIEAGAYVEFSPSGKGIKGIGRGKKPGAYCCTTKFPHHVEIYEHKRPFTVTGRLYPGCEPGAPIGDCQDVLNDLYGEVFADRLARAQAQAARPASTSTTCFDLDDRTLLEAGRRICRNFEALYDRGDCSGYLKPSGEPNYSSADMALLNHLAFLTRRDAFLMERLFSGSALGQRAKWREREDYRDVSIENAIAGCRNVYEPRETWQAGRPAAPVVRTVEVKPTSPAAATANKPKEPKEPSKPTQATLLVELFLDSDADLFRTPDGEPFVTIPVEASKHVRAHRETHPLQSKTVREWLGHRFYLQRGGAPAAGSLQDAFLVLRGESSLRRVQPVYSRVAPDGHGGIVVDLGDSDWSCVVIDRHGWEIIDGAPVPFRRASGMLPLPEPKRGGSVALLRDFLNVEAEEFPLVVAWLLGCFTEGPYAFLEIRGEQGSAKTTAARLLRSLVDPNKAGLRVEPRDPRDLAIAANNSHVIGYDNLSALSTWLSDGLCRLSTGGGFGVRKHYSDDEETLFDAKRPAIWTGITEIAHRSDLVDRTIFLTLPTIPEEDRRTERDFWEAFELVRPAILGALLDAVSMALRNQASVRLERLPRMADFATFVVAAEPALPWEPGAFLEAYTGNRKDANAGILESSPIASLITHLLDDCPEWKGTAEELLGRLETLTTEETRRAKWWPKNARTLGSNLRRLAPNLRSGGVSVEFGKSNATRWIRLVAGGTQTAALGTQTPSLGTQKGT